MNIKKLFQLSLCALTLTVSAHSMDQQLQRRTNNITKQGKKRIIVRKNMKIIDSDCCKILSQLSCLDYFCNTVFFGALWASQISSQPQ